MCIRDSINGIRGMVEIGDRCPEDMARQADCRKKIWEASTPVSYTHLEHLPKPIDPDALYRLLVKYLTERN